MALRIIDNKRVNLTDSEWQLYQEIVKVYTTQMRSGEDYFKDLFETDSNGIIIFLKPPTKNYSSMECFMFLVSVMIHQHLGSACTRVDALIAEAKEVTREARLAIDELKNLSSKKNS